MRAAVEVFEPWLDEWRNGWMNGGAAGNVAPCRGKLAPKQGGTIRKRKARTQSQEITVSTRVRCPETKRSKSYQREGEERGETKREEMRRNENEGREIKTDRVREGKSKRKKRGGETGEIEKERERRREAVRKRRRESEGM